MDRERFDELTRLLATKGSRRGALGMILSAAFLGHDPDVGLAKPGKGKGKGHGKGRGKGHDKDRDKGKGKGKGHTERDEPAELTAQDTAPAPEDPEADEPDIQAEGQSGGRGRSKSRAKAKGKGKNRKGRDQKTTGERGQNLQAETTTCCGTKSCPKPAVESNRYRCNFAGQNLSGTPASIKKYNSSNFGQIDGRRTNFDYTNVREANFGEACLQGATFRGANVASANFGKACLFGADFTGAKNFNVTVNFATALLCGTKLADGTTSDRDCDKTTPCCGGCVSQRDCGSGKVCCRGTCKGGDCCGNGDCPANKPICDNFTCGPCTTDPQCGAGKVCCNGICCTAGQVCDTRPDTDICCMPKPKNETCGVGTQSPKCGEVTNNCGKKVTCDDCKVLTCQEGSCTGPDNTCAYTPVFGKIGPDCRNTVCCRNAAGNPVCCPEGTTTCTAGGLCGCVGHADCGSHKICCEGTCIADTLCCKNDPSTCPNPGVCKVKACNANGACDPQHATPSSNCAVGDDLGVCCVGQCVIDDPDNCTACGAACAAAVCEVATCNNRVCGTDKVNDEQAAGCNGAGFLCCNGSCVDTDEDEANCGGCAPPNGDGDVCTPDETCDGGTCECATGFQPCGEICIPNAQCCEGNNAEGCTGTNHCCEVAGNGVCRECCDNDDCPCGTCPINETTCNTQTGECVCTGSCTDKVCGSDGCGANDNCGVCPANSTCNGAGTACVCNSGFQPCDNGCIPDAQCCEGNNAEGCTGTNHCCEVAGNGVCRECCDATDCEAEQCQTVSCTAAGSCDYDPVNGTSGPQCDSPLLCCQTSTTASTCCGAGVTTCDANGGCGCPADKPNRCSDGTCQVCCDNDDCENPNPICGASRTCVPCLGTAECDDGEVCCDGECLGGVCCEDDDCQTTGNDCADNQCFCGDGQTCQAPTPLCCGTAPDGECQECCENTDCEANETCLGGECCLTANVCGDVCLSTPCSTAACLSCDAATGACVSDCAPALCLTCGTGANVGSCVSTCTAGQPVCNPANGMCSCPAPRPTCGGVCCPFDPPGSNNCSGSGASAKCRCQNDTHCPTGSSCCGGVCETGICCAPSQLCVTAEDCCAFIGGVDKTQFICCRPIDDKGPAKCCLKNGSGPGGDSGCTADNQCCSGNCSGSAGHPGNCTGNNGGSDSTCLAP